MCGIFSGSSLTVCARVREMVGERKKGKSRKGNRAWEFGREVSRDSVRGAAMTARYIQLIERDTKTMKEGK